MSLSRSNPAPSHPLLGELELSVHHAEEELGRLRQTEQMITELLQNMLLQIDQICAATAGESRRSAQYWELLLEVADRCFAVYDPAIEPVREQLCTGFRRLGYTFYGLRGEKVTDFNAYDIVGTTSHGRETGMGTSAGENLGHCPPGGTVPVSSWVVMQVLKIGLRGPDGATVRRAKVVVGPTP
jgi:hypothetical protein